MKNFLTAIVSALLVAVIVTSLYTLIFASSEPSPLSLFVLSFLGMAVVALFNVRQSALRSGLAAAAPAAASIGSQTGRAKSTNRQSSGRGGRNRGDRNRNDRAGKTDKKDKPAPQNAPKAAANKTPVAPAVIPDGPRETGTVKWFNRSKGFGFIIRDNGEEIFVHHRSIRNSDEARRSNLRDGQTVNYVVADHAKGQQAEDVVGE